MRDESQTERADDGIILVHHEGKLTRSPEGEPTGRLIPIWNKKLDAGFQEPHQVYVTTVFPGKMKGPHLHMRRQQYFTCISGNCLVIVRLLTGIYRGFHLGSKAQYNSVIIKPGLPAALYNFRPEEAIVLNLPRPAWTPEDPDDHPVECWNPDQLLGDMLR